MFAEDPRVTHEAELLNAVSHQRSRLRLRVCSLETPTFSWFQPCMGNGMILVVSVLC